MKLSDRALLVQLNISMWGDSKEDKELSKKLVADTGGKAGAYRARKSLMSDCDVLADIKKKATFIRQKFYQNTLPWGMKGTHILPSKNYLAFMTDFRKEKGEFEALVNKFVPDYDYYRSQAKATLGTGFKESDYPTNIHEKFSIGIAIRPVPTEDFRVDIADEELERIREEVKAEVRQAEAGAMREAWDRLHKVVSHLADKLNDPKAIFRDTTVENVQELCGILSRLNITDDPNLEGMRSVVEQKLVGYHPDSLRNDPDLRRSVGNDAKSIADAMGAFMGGMN
jgi:hypothetical protein